jgi:hypothetical protein
MQTNEPFIVAVTVTNESGQTVMQFQYDWNDRDPARNAARTIRDMLADGYTVSSVRTDA